MPLLSFQTEEPYGSRNIFIAGAAEVIAVLSFPFPYLRRIRFHFRPVPLPRAFPNAISMLVNAIGSRPPMDPR